MNLEDWTTTTLDGFVFARPKSWSVDLEHDEDGTTAYLQSEGISFGVVGVYSAEGDPDDVAEQVLESVREEHPGLEMEGVELDEVRYPAGVGWEGIFMTLDTVAYCWIRSWRDGDRCLVVYVQAIQPEAGESEEIFGLMSKSFLPLAKAGSIDLGAEKPATRRKKG